MDSSAGQRDVKENTSGKSEEVKSENFTKSNEEKRNALTTNGTETSKDANESIMTAMEATTTTTNEEVRDNGAELTGDSFQTASKIRTALSGRKNGKPMDTPTNKHQRGLHTAMPLASQRDVNADDTTPTSFAEKMNGNPLSSKEQSKRGAHLGLNAAGKLKGASDDSNSSDWSTATPSGARKFKNENLHDPHMNEIEWEVSSPMMRMSNRRTETHRQTSVSKGETDENVKPSENWTKLQEEKENQATTVGTGTNEDAKQSSTPTTPRKELQSTSKGSTGKSSQSNSEKRVTPGGKRLTSESPREDSHTDESTDGETSEGEKDPELMNVPPMELNQYYFLLSKPDCPETLKEEAKTKLMEIVKLNQMGPYYENVCKELKWPIDQELRKTFKQANDKHIQHLNDKLLLAKKTRTGSDKLRSILLEKASYLCSIGRLKQSLEVYDLAIEVTIGASRRMDVKMEQLRICMFLMNKALVNSKLEEVREIDRTNVDWERRTRLKAYEGYYAMLTRDYEKASAMLLDLTCTFRSYELMTLDNMVLYAVIASAIVMDRQNIQKRILNATDIAPFLYKNPLLRQYVETLYQCKYAAFFRKLVDMEAMMKMDYVLAPNYKHVVRAMRLKAYLQFLTPYRTVTLQYMADEFGITAETLVHDLELFIRHRLLRAKIDGVRGYLETFFEPAKVQLKETVLEETDQLIERIWKLKHYLK
ncbi:hypothetical protein M514_02677 [Trichuris suis]|uniref:PCI domain-containing protein n=1 Tax=Trichuris suis TaxID=68888 RepID=A0A085MH77_9BILA|nr:hypothetical protein M513_02677 [Trichuris suis]KFD71098.1 hypothetical protein M514_02677 [Trichuris suis]